MVCIHHSKCFSSWIQELTFKLCVRNSPCHVLCTKLCLIFFLGECFFASFLIMLREHTSVYTAQVMADQSLCFLALFCWLVVLDSDQESWFSCQLFLSCTLVAEYEFSSSSYLGIRLLAELWYEILQKMQVEIFRDTAWSFISLLNIVILQKFLR